MNDADYTLLTSALTIGELAQIEFRIDQFQRMRATLRDLLAACPGSGELDQCSIVEALSATARHGQRQRLIRVARGEPI